MTIIMYEPKLVDLLSGKDSAEFCHLVNEQEPFPPVMKTLCGEIVDPSDYAPDSPLPECPACQQLAMYYR